MGAGGGGGGGVNKGLRHADYCFLDERRIIAGLFAQRLSPGQGSILRALLASATAACLCLCLRSLETGEQPTEWLMKPPRNSPGRATKEVGRGMKRLSNTSGGTALVDDQKCRRPAVLPIVSPNKSEEVCVIGGQFCRQERRWLYVRRGSLQTTASVAGQRAVLLKPPWALSGDFSL